MWSWLYSCGRPVTCLYRVLSTKQSNFHGGLDRTQKTPITKLQSRRTVYCRLHYLCFISLFLGKNISFSCCGLQYCLNIVSVFQVFPSEICWMPVPLLFVLCHVTQLHSYCTHPVYLSYIQASALQQQWIFMYIYIEVTLTYCVSFGHNFSVDRHINSAIWPTVIRSLWSNLLQWNSLPSSLKPMSFFPGQFCQRLKTTLFELAYACVSKFVINPFTSLRRDKFCTLFHFDVLAACSM